MDSEPRRGLPKPSSSLFFIAFKNKTPLLNIIIPIIDFRLELLPEMLHDKYSYYQNKHSEKLIASICLMSVCTNTRGGTHVLSGESFQSTFRRRTSYLRVNRQLMVLNIPGNPGDTVSGLRSAWHPQQWILHCSRARRESSCAGDVFHEQGKCNG